METTRIKSLEEFRKIYLPRFFKNRKRKNSIEKHNYSSVFTQEIIDKLKKSMHDSDKNNH